MKYYSWQCHRHHFSGLGIYLMNFDSHIKLFQADVVLGFFVGVHSRAA